MRRHIDCHNAKCCNTNELRCTRTRVLLGASIDPVHQQMGEEHDGCQYTNKSQNEAQREEHGGVENKTNIRRTASACGTTGNVREPREKLDDAEIEPLLSALPFHGRTLGTPCKPHMGPQCGGASASYCSIVLGSRRSEGCSTPPIPYPHCGGASACCCSAMLRLPSSSRSASSPASSASSGTSSACKQCIELCGRVQSVFAVCGRCAADTGDGQRGRYCTSALAPAACAQPNSKTQGLPRQPLLCQPKAPLLIAPLPVLMLFP